jgi:7-cyano-7-deazaguanine synthase
MKIALLMSGGIDSVALAWWQKPDIAYTIDYGQKSAEGEIRAATAVCLALSIPHRIITVDCRTLGSGDLAGSDPSPLAPVSEWWPFRNQLLLTIGGMAAVQDGVTTIFFGTVKTDSIHRDGTPQFFENAVRLIEDQEGNIQVKAPAITMTSVELIRVAGIDPSILSWAHSCHTSEFACGRCRGCNKHRMVMTEIGYGSY